MSDANRLPPEMVALVHHIELDKAGWWERALQSLTLTAFRLRPDQPALTTAEVHSTLLNHFRIDIDETSLGCAFQELVKQGDLLDLTNGNFRISEAATLRCQAEIAGSIDLEDVVRDQFVRQISLACPLIDGLKAWSAFVNDFLIPVVQDLGAGSYEILTAKKRPDRLPQVQDFTCQFPSEFSADLASFLHRFLDPSNPSVRRFVLRTMNAFFVVRASGLDKTTVERLSESARAFSATLFFDSNVLFSLLGLHENPADDSSRALLHLVRRLSASVPVRLRVLPPTLDEMKRVMKASQETLLELRISPTLLKSAI